MRNSQLPFNVAIDDSDTPRDVLDALILAAFTTGEQPFAQTKRLPKVLKDAALMPDSGQLQRVATDNGVRSHIVSGEGWTLRATRWSNSAEVTVTATSDELAARILKEATRNARDKREVPRDSVDMGFWHMGGSSRSSAARQVSCASRPRRRSATTSNVLLFSAGSRHFAEMARSFVWEGTISPKWR